MIKFDLLAFYGFGFQNIPLWTSPPIMILRLEILRITAGLAGLQKMLFIDGL